MIKKNNCCLKINKDNSLMLINIIFIFINLFQNINEWCKLNKQNHIKNQIMQSLYFFHYIFIHNNFYYFNNDKTINSGDLVLLILNKIFKKKNLNKNIFMNKLSGVIFKYSKIFELNKKDIKINPIWIYDDIEIVKKNIFSIGLINIQINNGGLFYKKIEKCTHVNKNYINDFINTKYFRNNVYFQQYNNSFREKLYKIIKKPAQGQDVLCLKSSYYENYKCSGVNDHLNIDKNLKKIKCYWCLQEYNLNNNTTLNLLKCNNCKRNGCKLHFFIQNNKNYCHWCYFPIDKIGFCNKFDKILDIIHINKKIYGLVKLNNKIFWCLKLKVNQCNEFNKKKKFIIQNLIIYKNINQLKIENGDKLNVFKYCKEKYDKKENINDTMYISNDNNIKFHYKLKNKKLLTKIKLMNNLDNDYINYGMYYTGDVFHKTIHDKFKQYIDYIQYVIKRDGENIINEYKIEKNHHNAFSGVYLYKGNYKNLSIQLLNQKTGDINEKYKIKNYSKIFIDNFFQNWKNVDQLCTGVAKSNKYYGIQSKKIPYFNEFLNNIYSSCCDIVKIWCPEINLKKKNFNCCQLNLGGLYCNAIMAPMWHIDNKMLFTNGVKSGVLCYHIKGWNTIITNKIEFESGVKMIKKNLNVQKEFFARQIVKYGFIKKPNSMYGMFDYAACYTQHAVLTNVGTAMIIDEYNKIIKKTGDSWCIKVNKKEIEQTQTYSAILRNVKM